MAACPHGVDTPTGRCQQCTVEANHEHHEFFQSKENERTPEEEADRLLGKAINLSSAGKRGDAALKVMEALDVAPHLSSEAMTQIQAARAAEGFEFRRYLREARQFIELEASQ